jgi:hypothetical protein
MSAHKDDVADQVQFRHLMNTNPGTSNGKFQARSLSDLMTPERDAGRLARKVEFIVACEVDDGSWCELDATDPAHAQVLARNWVDKLSARGCSCWNVRLMDGKLAPNSFFNYHWSPEQV